MLGSLSVNPKDKNGVTLLHRAARSGQHAIVHYFLSSGKFKTTATDKYGWTALHWAAWCGHLTVVRTLLKAGKDSVQSIDKTGSTPLHLACLQGHDKIVQLLLATEKCNINLQRQDGWCSLHLAVWNGHMQIIEELLKHGANSNEQTRDGLGAIHLASKKGFVDILKFLLEKGRTAIDMQDKNGNTSLHEAVKSDCSSAVKLLLDKECRINVKNKVGQTPIDLANTLGYSNIVILLAGLQCPLPSIPSVLCKLKDAEEMQMLFMRLDANCTIRNSDIKKHQHNTVFRNGSVRLPRQKMGFDKRWERRVRSTGAGLVANYEQRIKEIEGNHSPLERRISPFTTDTTRIPSAPLERTLSHNISLLSL